MKVTESQVSNIFTFHMQNTYIHNIPGDDYSVQGSGHPSDDECRSNIVTHLNDNDPPSSPTPSSSSTYTHVHMYTHAHAHMPTHVHIITFHTNSSNFQYQFITNFLPTCFFLQVCMTMTLSLHPFPPLQVSTHTHTRTHTHARTHTPAHTHTMDSRCLFKLHTFLQAIIASGTFL